MTNNQQSFEIDRRDFIKFVFGTASAVAVSGGSSIWPTEALTRPIAEPAKLALDDYNYLVDPYFDYNPQLPTYREFLSLENLSNSELKDALKDDTWRFEHHLKDPDNWSVHEIQGWLEESIDFDDMSPWNAAQYTEYGNGIRLYDAYLTKMFWISISLYWRERSRNFAGFATTAISRKILTILIEGSPVVALTLSSRGGNG